MSNFALSSTVYFQMYPVPPIIKILHFRGIEREFWMKWINVFKQNKEFGLSLGNSQFQTNQSSFKYININFVGLIDAYQVPQYDEGFMYGFM